MKIEEIEVTIGNDGKIQLQTSGFSGDACIESTAEIEKLLGSVVLQRERTSESFDTETIHTANKQKIRC